MRVTYAPIGRDKLSAMRANRAEVLENTFPTIGSNNKYGVSIGIDLTYEGIATEIKNYSPGGFEHLRAHPSPLELSAIATGIRTVIISISKSVPEIV